jgi:hypothetical protein
MAFTVKQSFKGYKYCLRRESGYNQGAKVTTANGSSDFTRDVIVVPSRQWTPMLTCNSNSSKMAPSRRK